MKFMLDTLNLDQISYYQAILPLAGVTTNPSIIKKEGKIDLFHYLSEIKKVIGQADLHVQVVGETKDDIEQDAQTIIEQLGTETFIKVPVTEAGLATIKSLKKKGIRVTATAIYTEFQGYLAIAAGADYLAPYYNRMENLNINAANVIHALVEEIHRTSSKSEILAASFKNVGQVNQACRKGAQAVTLSPSVFAQAFNMPAIQQAVNDFHNDWRDTFHTENIHS
ncbi:fructose-6-phosphate aldolase [Tetragenococcus halophilus]|uniref:fructose-6-phosphate aldolase n=1 Tax=Tetragenococcus halophilus TaxID=51669 RepID=UPI0015B7E5C4|nr:fructose-6-phosphate aldolase [Tetragenococcus halophilus]NWN99657.1 fructose-6-phosphate aldolase [Tetragenococcus halophilus]